MEYLWDTVLSDDVLAAVCDTIEDEMEADAVENMECEQEESEEVFSSVMIKEKDVEYTPLLLGGESMRQVRSQVNGQWDNFWSYYAHCPEDEEAYEDMIRARNALNEYTNIEDEYMDMIVAEQSYLGKVTDYYIYNYRCF